MNGSPCPNIKCLLIVFCASLALALASSAAAQEDLEAGQNAQEAPVPAGEMTQPAADDAEPSDPAAAMDAEDIRCEVVETTGRVEWRPDDQSDWAAVEPGLVLPVGADIRTSIRSEVRLRVGPSVDATVGGVAFATVGELTRENETLRTRLVMERGRVRFDVQRVGFQNDFRIATPSGTMAVRGTEGVVETYERTVVVGTPANSSFAIVYSDTYGEQDQLSGNQSTRRDRTGFDANEPTGEGGFRDEERGGDPGVPVPETAELRRMDSMMQTSMQFRMAREAANGGGED